MIEFEIKEFCINTQSDLQRCGGCVDKHSD